MTTLAETSLQNANALLREARAVNRLTKSYTGLQRGSASGSVSAEAVSKAIVLAYLGGAR